MPLIKYVTRFNPTINGPLHVGHIYAALVNEYEAHASGGKFIVRFEDNQREWVWKVPLPDAIQIMDEMRKDLEWMGIQADDYQNQSFGEREVKDTLHMLAKGDLPVSNRFTFDANPELTYSDVIPYPYAPILTAERVVMDYLSGINLLIRGEDLVSEYSLYSYFCEVFGIARPRMVYIPRLTVGGKEILPPDMSKTKGGYKICDYRKQGVSCMQVMATLRDSCLIDPAGEWSLRNIKRQPVWVS